MKTNKKVLIDGKAVSLEDTKMVMSFASPTPKWASNIFNIWTALAGVMALILVGFAEYIPVKVDDIISRVLIIGTPALRIITKSFGIELKDK